MSFHKVPVLIMFLILLLALVVPVSATDFNDTFESAITKAVVNTSMPFSTLPANSTFGSLFSENGITYMFVSNLTDGNIWVHNTTDGLAWGTGSLVISKGTGAWDATSVGVASILKEGSTYYLIYRGISGTSLSKVGLASSTTIDSGYVVDPANPVYTNVNWSVQGAEPWGLQKVGNTYYLWVNNLGGHVADPPTGTGVRQTGLVTSTDLHNWTEDPENPIFIGYRFCPAPFKIGSLYYILVPHKYGTDWPYMELYSSPSPTFHEDERTFIGSILYTNRNTTSPLGESLDTPAYVVTGNTSEALTADPLEFYYAAQQDTADTWYMSKFTISQSSLTTPSLLNDTFNAVSNEPTTKFSLSSVTAYTGSKSLLISPDNTNSYYYVATNLKKGNYSFYINQSILKSMTVFGFSDQGDFIQRVNFNATNGKISYYDGAVLKTGDIARLVNRWYKIDIGVDVPNDTYSYVLSNESGTLEAITGINSVTTAANINGVPHVAGIVFSKSSAQTTGNIFIDDLYVNDASDDAITPVASFTTNVTSDTVPLAVGFTDTSTNTPTSWNWSFGDGNWSNGTSSAVSYLYEYPGTYNALLIASNSGGSSTSATTAITVTSGIIPQCEDQTGNITLALFFNSTTSLGWQWSDPVNITKIAEDGLYVLTFDNSSDSFIGTGYLPESWHRLRIYNETDFGQLNCTTDALPVIPTPIPIMPSTESNVNPANLFQYWPYALLVLGLVVVFKKW